MASQQHWILYGNASRPLQAKYPLLLMEVFDEAQTCSRLLLSVHAMCSSAGYQSGVSPTMDNRESSLG